MIAKSTVKTVLGDLPFAAEAYWQIMQGGKPLNKSFSLQCLEKSLPEWCATANTSSARFRSNDYPKRRIMVFTTLRYWIEHAALMGSTLAGMGHQVDFTYLPYPNWRAPFKSFDIRRHNAYARSVFHKAYPLLQPLSFLDIKPISEQALPAALMQSIQEVSLRDTQYTLQIEDVDQDGGDSESFQIYQLRLQRNIYAAGAALGWLRSRKPDEYPEVLLTPNGSILEMGALYQVARMLGIPIVTYEFGEQRGRIWLAQNSEVMLQETDDLWLAFNNKTLSEQQWDQMRALYASRQNANLWENFSRLWQGLPKQGSNQVRQALDLDARPVILLAANVIGDSLTLGRQVFTKSMTEWLQYTVGYFARRPDVQLVVRIHPGERYIQGPSVAHVVQSVLPELPDYIHLVGAQDPVNTYDLVDIADLGLVYTTTVGMELAMSGVPVIVAGKTHYRAKGFSLDPNSWKDYDQLLERCLSQPDAYIMSPEQVQQAWNYAYHFFFTYPCPFPWHLLDFWEELETWSMQRVLSDEGQSNYGDTFSYLSGEPREWVKAPSLVLGAVE